MGLCLLSTPSKSLQSMGNSLRGYVNLFLLFSPISLNLMLDRICDLNAKVLDYHFDFV